MEFLARYWWLVLARGVLGIVLAVLAFALPLATLTALVLLFGAFALVDGVLMLFAAARGRPGERRWPVLLQGGLGVALGVLALVAPFATAVAVVVVIAAWAILTGAFQVIAAMQLRRVLEGEWLLALGGALSIGFGVLLVVFPSAGLVVLVWLFGAYWLISGIALTWLGNRLRRARGRVISYAP